MTPLSQGQREVWLYGPTETGFSLGVRQKKVKATGRIRRSGTPRKRRVFKGAAGFSRKRLDPMTMMPVLWRYLYPAAFDPLPPVPPPFELEEAGQIDRAFLSLDYDPRLIIPLDDLLQFLRDEVVNDPTWIEWAGNCLESEPAGHPLYEVHPVEGDEEEMLRDVTEQFRLPPEWAKLDRDEYSQNVMQYFGLLASVITQIKPDDLGGWFEFGYTDTGAFGLWYYECREEPTPSESRSYREEA